MNKTVFITGDTHGRIMERIANISTPPTETVVIILGDAGINFYLNKTDEKNKKILNKTGFTFYCVRGNHEERPENLNMSIVYDDFVCGNVYFEPKYPNIMYFMDGGEYTINGHKILVIGGAYSVDKWYRIAGRDISKWTGWFKDEQLTLEEMNKIAAACQGKEYDFIFTHTCPISWEPTDLFIGGLDQSSVDKSMELWLEDIKNIVSWKIWLFGHYHADRLERPCVEMYFHDIEDLETIYERWTGNKELEWWLTKSPNYYME